MFICYSESVGVRGVSSFLVKEILVKDPLFFLHAMISAFPNKYSTKHIVGKRQIKTRTV